METAVCMHCWAASIGFKAMHGMGVGLSPSGHRPVFQQSTVALRLLRCWSAQWRQCSLLQSN